MWRGITVQLVLTSALGGATALNAQDQPRGFLRLEAGRAEIHRASSTGIAVAFRIGRRLEPRGLARVELGASYSAADEGYRTVEVGAEVRPLAGARLTPVAGVGAGLLLEPEFTGEVIRATVAIDIVIAPRAGLRLGAQVGEHGGARGPTVFFGGLELRGRKG